MDDDTSLDGSAGADLRIAVMGPLVVTTSGSPAPIRLRPAERRLLSFLVLAEGRRSSADALIDRMWAEAPPPTARAALQTHVGSLRRRLEVDVLSTEGSQYRLDPDRVCVDVDDFTDLVERGLDALAHGDAPAASETTTAALELVRGQPYEEIADEEPARAELLRLDELRLTAVETLAESMLALGREANVVADLERLAVLHPHRERLWEHLIVARHRLGRHRDAVEGYRCLVDSLAEVGLEPTMRVRELETRVLRHDPSIVAPRYRTRPPRPATSFIGRADDLDHVPELLESHPLVSLVGPGGVGKTRLALELCDRSDRDVAFVDLTSTRDPHGVVTSFGNAIGLQPDEPSSDRAPSFPDRMVEALSRRPRLLVLDNCEHVLDACAQLVELVVGEVPGVRMLTTSREPLGVYGERVHRVRTLSTTGSGSEAVALFAARAEAAGATLDLDGPRRSVVRHICERLDGLPLAIEFAAARCVHLPPEEIDARLDHRFGLLRGFRGSADRHRTMETALAWSHDLLDEDEKVLLRRLAVFAGPFGLELAELVCSDAALETREVLGVLSRLVDRSLVVADHDAGHARYRLLETVRAFAAERLDAADETDALRERHCRSYLQWLESRPWGAALRDPEFASLLVDELDNVRAALAWAADAGEVETLGRLAARSHLAWSPTLGNGIEGRRWLDLALADATRLDADTQAACWSARSLASATIGSADQESDAERAIAVGEALGGYICEAHGVRSMAPALRALATDDDRLADLARTRLEEFYRSARRHDRDDWLQYARLYEGQIAMLRGDLERATDAYAAAFESTSLAWIHRRVLGPELAVCRYLQGDHAGAIEAVDRLGHGCPRRLPMPPMLPAARGLAAAALGRADDARADLRTAAAIADRDAFLEVNACLTFGAGIALEQGRLAQAAQALGASARYGNAERTDFRFRNPSTYALHLHVRSELRTRLPAPQRRAEQAHGRSLDDDRILDLLDEIAGR